MEVYYMNTEIGILEIKGDKKGLSSVLFIDDEATITKISGEKTSTVPLSLMEVVSQLHQYFKGDRNQFNLTLNPQGTSFQKKVWSHLLSVTYGKTKSYQQIATELGDPKVIRAAASANGKNPISIIIPCHRIIGSDGSLTGYAGGLHRKKWLLNLESAAKQQSLF